MRMRRNFGTIAALFAGASLVWSCTGEVGPNDSQASPKGGAGGAAGRPVVGGAAGNSGGGGAAKPTSMTTGAAGKPATGAAGQAGNGNGPPPATGAAGQAGDGSVPPPATGAAGQAGNGSVPPPATGAAGQSGGGSAGKPATGAAGQAGSGSVPPPATGAAGQGGSGTPSGTGGAAPSAGGAAGTTTPPATSAAATIVPLYTDPSDASWSAVIAAKMAHPKVGVVAIVNPNNGPGSAASSGYTSGIARLTAAGIKVIGYVATGYASRTAAVVEADIDRWKTFYPGQLGGIFFDEQSNLAKDVAHYSALSQYAKSQGLSFTVGNPGTDTADRKSVV